MFIPIIGAVLGLAILFNTGIALGAIASRTRLSSCHRFAKLGNNSCVLARIHSIFNCNRGEYLVDPKVITAQMA